MKTAKSIGMALAFVSAVSAADYTCQDIYESSEPEISVKSDFTKYQFQLSGSRAIEKFLTGLEVKIEPKNESQPTLTFELAKSDCRESQASRFAISCSGRDVKVTYSGTETFSVQFLNFNVIDRTDVSAQATTHWNLFELQGSHFDLSTPKMVMGIYQRTLSHDMCR